MTSWHPAIAAFLSTLRATGRPRSAETYATYLAPFQGWVTVAGHDLLHLTTAQLADYQRQVAARRHHRTGAPLSAATRATSTIAVRVLFRWLHRRGMVPNDPAAALRLPRVPRRLTVAKDHLSQQEVIALIQTQAACVDDETPGTVAWARALRNLALVSTALATGRRVFGLVTLRVDHLDLDRGELRVAVEKGRTGRVLPVATWCIDVLRRYLSDARPLMIGNRASPYLFPSRRSGHIGVRGFAEVLEVVMAETIRWNPDLVDLPHKRISTHSLRVSFAALLFANGCNIRSLNELMLHERLSTTAQYTPITVDALRSALHGSHPRG